MKGQPLLEAPALRASKNYGEFFSSSRSDDFLDFEEL
jgi:hypothetical protein